MFISTKVLKCLQALFGSIAAMMGTGILCRSLPYTEGFGSKQLAWMLHSAVVGAVIAPMTLLGGPLLVRAACYTAGVVGGWEEFTFISLLQVFHIFFIFHAPISIAKASI